MHFVSGGAFNGKRKWVETAYPDAYWVSVYKKERLEIPVESPSPTIVFEGIHEWIRQLVHPELSADVLFDRVEQKIKRLLEWERGEANRQLVLIGTDISKGIVPLEKIDRLTRDVTGWVYQKLVKEADQVAIIWYGIAQQLK